MVEINITDAQREKAKEHFEFYNIRNSFTKGKKQIYGALGEICLLEYLGLEYNSIVGTKDYDIDFNGIKLEVKTKMCKSVPRPDYFCSVAVTSFHQDCDNYIFVRVSEDCKKAWVLGQLSRKEFFDASVFFKKGDVDPSSRLNFTFKETCANVKVCDLKPIPTIIGFDEKISKFYESNFSELKIENNNLILGSTDFSSEVMGNLEISGIAKKNGETSFYEKSKGRIFMGMLSDYSTAHAFFDRMLMASVNSVD